MFEGLVPKWYLRKGEVLSRTVSKLFVQASTVVRPRGVATTIENSLHNLASRTARTHVFRRTTLGMIPSFFAHAIVFANLKSMPALKSSLGLTAHAFLPTASRVRLLTKSRDELSSKYSRILLEQRYYPWCTVLLLLMLLFKCAIVYVLRFLNT